MTTKLALVLLASLLFGSVIIQSVASQPSSPSPTPSESSSPTEEPTSTPDPQPKPPSPWELMLLVFTSVALAALVITSAQKLRERRITK